MAVSADIMQLGKSATSSVTSAATSAVSKKDVSLLPPLLAKEGAGEVLQRQRTPLHPPVPRGEARQQNLAGIGTRHVGVAPRRLPA